MSILPVSAILSKPSMRSISSTTSAGCVMSVLFDGGVMVIPVSVSVSIEQPKADSMFLTVSLLMYFFLSFRLLLLDFESSHHLGQDHPIRRRSVDEIKR
jgi:hypothetical protein